MAKPTIVVHEEWDLAEILWTGRLTMAEVLEEIQVINKAVATKRFLWDVSRCDFSAFRGADTPRNSAAILSLVELRVGGRTAVIAATDLSYGLTRMYQAYRQDFDGDFPFMIFRARQAAIDWLQSAAE